MWVVSWKCPDGLSGEERFYERPQMVVRVTELLRDFYALRLSVVLR